MMIKRKSTSVEISLETTKDTESIETSHCRKTKSRRVNVCHKLAD